MSLRLWYPLKRDYTNHGCQRADYRNEIKDSIGTTYGHAPVGDDGFLFGNTGYSSVSDNEFIQDTSETCENAGVGDIRPLLNNLSSACVTNEKNALYIGARCTKSQIFATMSNMNFLRPFTLSANIVGAPHFFFGIGLYKTAPTSLTSNMSTWFNDCLGFVRVNNVPNAQFQVYGGASQYYTEIMSSEDRRKYMPYRSDIPHNYMIINDDKARNLSFYIDGVLFNEITGNNYTTIVNSFFNKRSEQIFFGLYHIPSNATANTGWEVGRDGPEANIAINDLRLYDTAIGKKQIHEIVNNLDIHFKLDEIRYDGIPLFGEKGLSTYHLKTAGTSSTLKKFNDVFVNTSFNEPFKSLRIKVTSADDSSVITECATPIELKGCNTGIRRVFFRLDSAILNNTQFRIQGFLESGPGNLEILNLEDNLMYTGDGNDYVFEVNILDNQANSLYIKDIAIRTTECTDDNGCHKVGVVMSDSSQIEYGLRNSKNSVVYGDFDGCPASNTFASNFCTYYPVGGKSFISRHGLNLSVGRIQGRENQFMTKTFTMNFWAYLSKSSNKIDALFTDGGSCITLNYDYGKEVLSFDMYGGEYKTYFEAHNVAPGWRMITISTQQYHFSNEKEDYVFSPYMSFYVDGILQADDEVGATIRNNSYFISNEFEAINSEGFSDFRLYNRVLSENDIENLYHRSVFMNKSDNSVMAMNFIEPDCEEKHYLTFYTNDDFEYNFIIKETCPGDEELYSWSSSNQYHIEWSYDTKNWTVYTRGTSVPFSRKKPLYVRGINYENGSTNTLGFYSDDSDMTMVISIEPGNLSGGQLVMDGVYVDGNIIDLLDYRIGTEHEPEDIDDDLKLGYNACAYLFSFNEYLKNTPDFIKDLIPLYNYNLLDLKQENVYGIYQGMFFGCINLKYIKPLPSKHLGDSCYSAMFFGCTVLENAPELPATTLASECYTSMFQGCTALKNVHDLPARTLKASCYANMFYDCTSLTKAPEIGIGSSAATLVPMSLANNCCSSMFSHCSSLVKAPKLYATSLAQSCYQSMFYGCTALKDAPELPATALASSCYYRMFYGCTKLVTASTLPAATLPASCYYDMFHGCTSLTKAPVINAKTFNGNNCCGYMFYGCTALKEACFVINRPSTSYSGIFNYMFQSCSNLKKVFFVVNDASTTALPANQVTSCFTGAGSAFAANKKNIYVLSTNHLTNASLPSGWNYSVVDAVDISYWQADMHRITIN